MRKLNHFGRVSFFEQDTLFFEMKFDLISFSHDRQSL